MGDLELTPGFTSYPTQQLVQAYDVTALLVQGSNRWEVVVSDGWYRGQLGMRRRTDGYGDTLAFLGQLECDGLTVSTDSAWTVGVGRLVAADPMAGQIEDHVRASKEWQPVAVGAGTSGPFTGLPRHPSAGSSTYVPSRSRGSLPVGRWPTSARTSTVGCG